MVGEGLHVLAEAAPVVHDVQGETELPIPFVWMPAGGDILAPGLGSSNSAPAGLAELGTLACGATPVPSGLPFSGRVL